MQSKLSWRKLILFNFDGQKLDQQSALEFCPIHCPNGRLGQGLGFGEFAFALELPELLNRNLAAVRAKLGQISSFINGPQIWFPNLIPNRAMNLGAQLGPLSITKLSPNWACQMGPIHFINFLLSGNRSLQFFLTFIHSSSFINLLQVYYY